MLREAIDRILSLAPITTRDIAGMTYSDRAMVLVEPPKVDTLSITSLTGMVDYIRSGEPGRLTKEEDGNIFLQAVSSTLVRLMGPVGKDGKRNKYAVAEFDASKEFPFGSPMSPEAFITAFKSNAVPPSEGSASDFNLTLKIVSSISLEHLATMTDSKVTQQVALKQRVQFNLQEIPAFLDLEFRRTFPEIGQYRNQFFLRVKGKDQNVTISLHETTKDRWESQCRHAIKEWLNGQVFGSNIVLLE